MKVALSYSVPVQTEENWATFKPDVQRFVASWLEFPPAIDCTLFAMCLQNEPRQEVKELFDGLPVIFMRYDGTGFDGGAAQFLSKQLDGYFLIGMGARAHFHRKGAVREMAIARHRRGPGLYGCTCSKEARLHIRPSFYGIDSNYLRLYPPTIDSPESGTQFEIGNQFGQLSLLSWCDSIGIPSWMVYWNGIFANRADWFSQPHTFRRGDQSNLLAWDKRTDLYAAADEEEKKALAELAFGLANPSGPS